MNSPRPSTGPNGDYTYAYNKDGKVTSRGYPDGSTITYTYDADQRLGERTQSAGRRRCIAYNADSS